MRKRELGTESSPSANTRSRRAVRQKERSPVVLNPRHEAKHSAPGIQCLSNDDISDARVEPDTTPPTSPRRNPRRGIAQPSASETSRRWRRSSPQLVSSEDEEMVSPRKPRKILNIPSDSDDNPPRKRLHRRHDPDSEDSSSEVPVTPRKRRKTLNVATSDSDDRTPPKRIRRRESNVDDSDSGSPAGDDRVSAVDSADVDDLELSPPPSPSKPTAKERKRITMDEYKNARENRSSPNKSSPISTRRTKVEETSDSDELAWGSDTNSSDSDTGSESESSENMGSFIVDDSEKIEDPDADDIESARGPEYYARRKLSEQFTSFVEYLVRFYLNPGFLSTVSDNDRWSYQAAIKAMRIRTEGVADSMQLSTWSTPFKTTLDSRPILIGPHPCESVDCQACWTRGSRACNVTGCCTLTTHEGTYNRDNFDDESESDDDYGEETTWDFSNSAHADKLRYPPGFRLVVGARCARKAVAYHQARHYLYNNIFARVKTKIKWLCRHEDPALASDAHALVGAHQEFTAQLWNDFCLDRKQWTARAPSPESD